jgi:serine/threonine-protein kinase
MSANTKHGVDFEIGHVLFVDTVAYSQLLIDEQREVLAALNRVIKETPCVRRAESANKLIRLPTGDGVALVFYDSPEAPVECALEIGKTLKTCPQLKLRMGIHSGPVSRVLDVNDQSNVAGAGINVAQRVMGCGDAGHILVSRRAAEDLAVYKRWEPYLHELGECEVKHAMRLCLFNLYTEEVGNPALPDKMKAAHELAAPAVVARERNINRRKVFLIAASLLIFGSFGALYFSFHQQNRISIPKTNFVEDLPVREKGIAVLPFSNLSDNKEDAYFAEGMQDEILTVLAKAADLKVISRTSVMQYKDEARRNLREIARALGVAHVVEGTVQRVGDRIRVSAQLIDARSDSHLWAQHFDRPFTDVFAIQTELAGQIVNQLKARLSPAEKAAMEVRPTSDLPAYDLFVRARQMLGASSFGVQGTQNLFSAAQLLGEAVKRDPAFFLAYCRLASVHDQIYLSGLDRTSVRLALADSAIQSALRLRPDAGETHLALAEHRYCCYLDYNGASEQLKVARQLLPNEPLVFELGGYIDRRQGRWNESIQNLQRALELDPRNANVLQQIALSYGYLRRFAEKARVLEHALALEPDNASIRIARADVEVAWRADLKPLQETIEQIINQDPSAITGIADDCFFVALCERDQAAMQRALNVMPEHGYSNGSVVFSRAWCEGLAARVRNDFANAKKAFTEARGDNEKILRDKPDNVEALSVLGMIDAGLGNKEQAIEEGKRAVALLPVSKDSINGALLLQNLAVIYAWTGEGELASRQLELIVEIPNDVSYGSLKLHPMWDPLRGDPRFEKIVASLAPAAAAP